MSRGYNMGRKQWRTVRVVVEVPVRGAKFGECSLRNAVADVLDRHLDSGYFLDANNVGKVRIKQYSKVPPPMLPAQGKPPNVGEALGTFCSMLINELVGMNERLKKLEHDNDPHVRAGMD